MFLYILVFLLLTILSNAAVPDSDKDGVPDSDDRCSNSETTQVDQFGCSCAQKTLSDCKSKFPNAVCCAPDNNPCTDDCIADNVGRVSCSYFPNEKPCQGGYCSQGRCDTNIVVEAVICKFKNLNTEQRCYSDKGRCFGKRICKADLKGRKEEKIVWKSSCSKEEITTTIDGKDKDIEFNCIVPQCGNGVLEDGEFCDGNEFSISKYCADALSYYRQGSLKCNQGCRVDFSECILKTCGNGKLDVLEDCEGNLFDDRAKSCSDIYPFIGGTLRCSPNCKSDTSGCLKAQCNNKICEKGEGEFNCPIDCPRGNLGTQSTLVIIVAVGNESPADVGSIRDMVFSNKFETANDYFIRNSFGKLSLTGIVVGPYKLPETTCGIDDILKNSIKAADKDVYFPDYQRIVLVYTTDYSKKSCHSCTCGTIGKSWIQTSDGPVRASISWIGWHNFIAVSHELGHNLGMHHANTLECISCKSNEYGDQFDIMGNGPRHLNAPHKEEVGWLDNDNIIVTSEGEYLLKPLESKQPKGAIQQLKLPWKTNHLFYKVYEDYGVLRNLDVSYSLEYRQPVDYDSGIQNDLILGILIHLSAVPSLPYVFQTNLVRIVSKNPILTKQGAPPIPDDIVTSTGGKKYGDIVEAAPIVQNYQDLISFLPVGETYRDSVNDYEITVKSVDNSGALVNISRFRGENHEPVGSFDGFQNESMGIDSAYGWAVDPDTPKESVDVVLSYDDELGQSLYPIIDAKANLPNPDANKAGYPGNHGFNIPINEIYPDTQIFPIKIYAYAIDSWNGPEFELNGSPQKYTPTPKPRCNIIMPSIVNDQEEFNVKWEGDGNSVDLIAYHEQGTLHSNRHGDVTPPSGVEQKGLDTIGAFYNVHIHEGDKVSLTFSWIDKSDNVICKKSATVFVVKSQRIVFSVTPTEIKQGEYFKLGISNATANSDVMLYIVSTNRTIIADGTVVGVTDSNGTWSKSFDSSSSPLGNYVSYVNVGGSYSNKVDLNITAVNKIPLLSVVPEFIREGDEVITSISNAQPSSKIYVYAIDTATNKFIMYGDYIGDTDAGGRWLKTSVAKNLQFGDFKAWVFIGNYNSNEVYYQVQRSCSQIPCNATTPCASTCNLDGPAKYCRVPYGWITAIDPRSTCNPLSTSNCQTQCDGKNYYCIGYKSNNEWLLDQPLCGSLNDCTNATYCGSTVICYSTLKRFAYPNEAPAEICGNGIDDNCIGGDAQCPATPIPQAIPTPTYSFIPDGGIIIADKDSWTFNLSKAKEGDVLSVRVWKNGNFESEYSLCTVAAGSTSCGLSATPTKQNVGNWNGTVYINGEEKGHITFTVKTQQITIIQQNPKLELIGMPPGSLSNIKLGVTAYATIKDAAPNSQILLTIIDSVGSKLFDDNLDWGITRSDGTYSITFTADNTAGWPRGTYTTFVRVGGKVSDQNYRFTVS